MDTVVTNQSSLCVLDPKELRNKLFYDSFNRINETERKIQDAEKEHLLFLLGTTTVIATNEDTKTNAPRSHINRRRKLLTQSIEQVKTRSCFYYENCIDNYENGEFDQCFSDCFFEQYPHFGNVAIGYISLIMLHACYLEKQIVNLEDSGLVNLAAVQFLQDAIDRVIIRMDDKHMAIMNTFVQKN